MKSGVWAEGDFELLEAVPDAMLAVDRFGKILIANKHALELLGYCEQDLTGSSVELLIPERFRTNHPHHRANFFSSPKARPMGMGLELFALRRDGTEFPVEISLSHLQMAKGTVSIAAIRDVSERRRAQEQFRALLESAPDAMVIVNEQGLITLVNSQTEKLFGYTREELLGEAVEILIPHGLKHKHPEHRAAFFADARVRPMGAGLELRARRQDGTEFPVEISLSPLRTADGLLVTAAIRDVSPHKRFEQELKDQAANLEEYASLLELAHDSIIVRDMKGMISFWNSGAEATYGWSAAEAIGNRTHNLLRTEFPVPFDQVEAALMKKGKWEGELKHFRRDGSYVFVSSRWALKRGEEGKPDRILEINNDITAQKRAELKFQALLEAAPDAMVVVNTQGKIVLTNAQVEKFFGYTREELLGKPIEVLIPERYQAKHHRHRDGYISNTKVRPMGQGLELWAMRRDGSEFPVEISLSPLETEDGTLVTAAVRDVTARKAAESQITTLNLTLQTKVSDLAAMNKELEAFSYSVSHDLRAPLRHIAGFSKLLVEEHMAELSQDAQRYLTIICESTEHMGCLVDELLGFARIGRQELKMRGTDLNLIVEQVSRELGEQHKDRRVDWKIQRLPAALCDPGLLKQVFTNLLSNAVKFTATRERALIEVGSLDGEDLPVIFVRDNGVGFDMKYADKLFGVFQRLHREEEFEGTGIGLATVQRIVQKHGRNIWAVSEVDKGATFYFTLMRSHAQLSPAQSSNPEKAYESHGS